MQTFTKKERLCSLRYKQTLFQKGQSSFDYPIKAFFLISDEKAINDSPFPGLHDEYPEPWCESYKSAHAASFKRQLSPIRVQVLITVSKRNFKRATDRNRLKRLIREGYRKNKALLQVALRNHEKLCLLSLSYVGRQILRHSQIEQKIVVILQKIAEIAKSATVSENQ